jgi:hypothetical protein
LLAGVSQHLIGIIAPVGHQGLRAEAGEEVHSFRTIRHGTCCDKNSQRHTMRIHGQMYLGVEPPFVDPMASLPPLAPVP